MASYKIKMHGMIRYLLSDILQLLVLCIIYCYFDADIFQGHPLAKNHVQYQSLLIYAHTLACTL